jgi:hypothetical protein
VAVAQHATDAGAERADVWSAGAGQEGLKLSRSLVPLHVYMDLRACVRGLQASYTPGLEAALEGVAARAVGALPVSLLGLDPRLTYNAWRWWDLLRQLLHGRARVSCEGVALRLFPSDARETEQADEGYDSLDLECASLCYSTTKHALDVLGVAVRPSSAASPAPLPPLLVMSRIGLMLGLEWLTQGGSYRIHPPRTTLAAPAPSDVDLDARYEAFRSSGLRVSVTCEVSGPGGAPFGEAPELVDPATLALIASLPASSTTIVCGGAAVPGYAWWATRFIGAMTAPRAGAKSAVIAKALSDLRGCVRSVGVTVGMHGLSVQVLDTHPEDPRRRGLAFNVAKRMGLAMTLAEEAEVPDPFMTGRILVSGPSAPHWSVHTVSE